MNNTEQFMQQPAAYLPKQSTGILQRKCGCGQHKPSGGKCESCENKSTAATLQRAAVNATRTNEAPSIVHDVLGSHGKPLDSNTRAFMEPRFGYDFSHVRIHDDARAVESARAVNALAYTVGPHVVFGSAQHATESEAGRRTLAHELAHVVQQTGAPRSLQAKGEPGAETGLSSPKGLSRIESQTSSSTSLRIGQAGDTYEQEADSVADAVMRSAPYSLPSSGLSGRIQRTPAPLLQRRLVINPTDMIPMPIPRLPVPLTTAMRGLLADTCPDGHFQVDATSGVVTPQHTTFCQQPPPPGPFLTAGVSSTPVSCGCICDTINDARTATIAFNPGPPGTAPGSVPGAGPGQGGVRTDPTVQIDPRVRIQNLVGGSWVDVPFWLVFAHELCGHALPKMRGTHAARGTTPPGGTPPSERHSVDIERQMAAERNPALPRRSEDYSGGARVLP